MQDSNLRAVMAQAAVCDFFDPRALVSAIADSAQQQSVLQQLARESVEVERNGAYGWSLLHPVRERVLADLSEADLRQALAAQPDDFLAIQIASILDKTKAVSDSESFRYRALELLRLAQRPAAAISPDDLDRQARKARAALDRQSAMDALRNTLRTPLRGRDKPLAFLRHFVRSGASAIDAQRAPLTGAVLFLADQTQRRWPEVPALLLGGEGGVGKSALMAELIRLERGPRWERRPVVHFDFDEPSLKAGDQGAMLLEFSRQIALARPALDKVLSDSRARLRQGLLASGRGSDGAFEHLKFLTHVELSHWRGPFAQRGIDEVVVILDTLEEVTTVDFKRLEMLFGWLDALRQGADLRRLLVIASGRALVPDGERAALWPYFLAELALGDLSAPSARAMLRDRLRQEGREAHIDQVGHCVEVFGGNPLALSILARYCLDNDAKALAAFLADTQAGEGLHRLGATAQRLLYARLLERVRDVDIRPLASPGLVLRRVTPQLISEVLAGPCGLGSIDGPRAEALLNKLRRLAWLVTPDGEGVRHRPDMRRQILPVILDRERERSEAINHAAANWYENQADPSQGRSAARLESWYHRGLLGEVASEQKDDLRALHDHLGEDVDDLPLGVRALVKHAGGRSLTQSEQSALPSPLRELVAHRHSRRLRAEGLDQAAFRKASVSFATKPLDPRPLQVHAAGVSTELLVSTGSGATSPPSDAQVDTELVTTLFATGNFEAAAAHLPQLLVRFWHCLLRGERIEARLTGDAAWLAAAAARAFSHGLVDWPSLLVESSPQFEKVGREPENYEMLVQVLVLEALLPSSAARLSDALRIPDNGTRTVHLGARADWKPAFVCARLAGAPDEFVKLATLPFLDPALLELLRQFDRARSASDTIDFAAIRASWKQALAGAAPSPWPDVVEPNAFAISVGGTTTELLSSEAPWDLVRIREVLQLAKSAEVSFDLLPARGSGLCPLGLVPELYAPIRTAFQAELHPDQIASLVAQVAASLSSWPVELAPRQFHAASRDRSNELLPVLLTISDYHGCLGKLVRAAAAQGPRARGLVRAAQLFDAFEAAWAL